MHIGVRVAALCRAMSRTGRNPVGCNLCAVRVCRSVEREQAGACKADHVPDKDEVVNLEECHARGAEDVLNVFYFHCAGMQSC